MHYRSCNTVLTCHFCFRYDSISESVQDHIIHKKLYQWHSFQKPPLPPHRVNVPENATCNIWKIHFYFILWCVLLSLRRVEGWRAL